MRLPFLTSLLIATAAILSAQNNDATLLPAPWPVYTQVKQYLGLTDPQIQSLESILRAFSQAQQDGWNQVAEKNRTLYQLLDSGTGSAAQIGQLMLDIRKIEKQFPALQEPYRQQAVNVLSADQKTKLAKLNESLQLQQTASEAAQLLLLEYPRYIGLPMPVDAGGGIGSAAPAGSRTSGLPMGIRRQ